MQSFILGSAESAANLADIAEAGLLRAMFTLFSELCHVLNDIVHPKWITAMTKNQESLVSLKKHTPRVICKDAFW